MKPENYLDGEYLKKTHWELTERSEKLFEVIKDYIQKEDNILELGCSAGRNLKYLYDAGYKNLTGLEMSKKAFDRIGDYTKKILGRFENKIDSLEKYDVVISMSFLQESVEEDAVLKLPKIVKKYLITVDNPAEDFEEIFTNNGLVKIKEFKNKESLPFCTPIKIYKKND